MGVDAAWRAPRLENAGADQTAPAWDRFAQWARADARVLLAAAMAMLVAAALVPITVGRGQIATPPAFAPLPGNHAGQARPRDDDLKLYDAAIARIWRGENYYRFIVAEHRAAHYPVRPAIAVRLPTLAYLDAWAGPLGQLVAACALMLGVLLAWWQRLGDEPGGLQQRNFAVALLFCGAALGLNRYYFALHELWAGMLIALSFGLHRPGQPDAGSPTYRSFDVSKFLPFRGRYRPQDGGGGSAWCSPLRQSQARLPPPPEGEDFQMIGAAKTRWLGAWCAAALALAIREHTLPFVLLMAAFAGWRQSWREAAAWGALIGLFAFGLAVHLHLIAAQALPDDPVGPSWLALRGLSGWLSDIILSSNLRFLPHWLAGPLVILMVLGWAGWRSAAGSFATLLYLGYGAAFMIAGRDDNFYWGAMIAPTMFMGLAFVPMAVRGLVASITCSPPACGRG